MKQTKPRFAIGDRVIESGNEYEVEDVFWNGFTWMVRMKNHPLGLSCGEQYLTRAKTDNQE